MIDLVCFYNEYIVYATLRKEEYGGCRCNSRYDDSEEFSDSSECGRSFRRFDCSYI